MARYLNHVVFALELLKVVALRELVAGFIQEFFLESFFCFLEIGRARPERTPPLLSYAAPSVRIRRIKKESEFEAFREGVFIRTATAK